ncbi:putative sugar transporter [Xylogone sp. PMI_703]|nr:putative sugar transporter [Xylogone sp. PMI_703]
MALSRTFSSLRGLRLKIAMILLVVMPSFLLFGYNNGSTGGIVGLESFVKQFPSLDTINTSGHTKSQNSLILGIVTACYDLGAVVGALSCILYSDKIGRLRTIFCGLVLSIVALVIEVSAFKLGQFIVGRLLVGASIGVISASIPVWQTECSTTNHRGMFVIIEGIFISAGIMLPSWISFGFFAAWTTSAQWRVTLVFPGIFALFAMPFLPLMPESPRWLARKGRMDEARMVVAAMMDQPLDSHAVNSEINRIQLQLEMSGGSFKLFFTGSKERYLHRAIIATLAQSMTQWNGCSALIFYTNIVFSDLGFSGTRARLIGGGFVTTFTVAAFIPMIMVDRIGRRVLFMIGAAGMCVSMAVLAGTSSHSNLAVVSTVFMFLYACSYAIGYLGLPFLYAGEISTIKMRVPITAVAVTGQWLGQFVVGQITPPGTTNLHNRYWIIFAVFNASFLPIIYFFFPETNGRSLEEIDEVFERSDTFSVVSNSRNLPKSRDVDIQALEGKHIVHVLDDEEKSAGRKREI